MLLNEDGRFFVEPQCWRLTDPGVVRLRRAVGTEAILCFFLEVFDHFMQGGHRHLQRTEQHCLIKEHGLYFYFIFSSVIGKYFNLVKASIKAKLKKKIDKHFKVSLWHKCMHQKHSKL